MNDCELSLKPETRFEQSVVSAAKEQGRLKTSAISTTSALYAFNGEQFPWPILYQTLAERNVLLRVLQEIKYRTDIYENKKETNVLVHQ
ncbi:hypothetical protein [Paenibacillus polymyxa]|uniref:hypothetical protein n=1 Tax=Paenibacillus polymyxa TaxID=1406 RepID=UPI001866C0BB|nr:hypothetical protein [Paenibacillus polymyxa]MBE3650937.1 hypothetical protein [Paenibacillus polymyxa]